METKVEAEKYESVAALVIYNLEEENVIFGPNLQALFGLINPKLGKRTYIKCLMAPTSYFIHSDFMSKTENLLNGKP